MLITEFETTGVEYRTFDGTGNNKDNPQWGAANTPYLRGNGTHSYPAKYADGKDEPLMMSMLDFFLFEIFSFS